MALCCCLFYPSQLLKFPHVLRTVESFEHDSLVMAKESYYGASYAFRAVDFCSVACGALGACRWGKNKIMALPLSVFLSLLIAVGL